MEKSDFELPSDFAGRTTTLTLLFLAVELDPSPRPYIHSATEPLEVDLPEILDPKYGRQN